MKRTTKYASCCGRSSRVLGVADARIQQASNYPIDVDVDRTPPAQMGLTEFDVTENRQVALSGSGPFAPTFWFNPTNGVSYPIVAQRPE